MSEKSYQKSSGSRKYGSERKNNLKESTSVITVRIDKELNDNLDKLRMKLGISKAELIRNYLKMSYYIIKQKSSIKSLNRRDFIVIKKSFLRKLIEDKEEEEQIGLGEKLARFINDIATINGKEDDLDYKLSLCDNLGFFPKDIDDEGYILITKKFGSRKFVESFIWKLFKENNFNLNWIESKIESQSKIKTAYEKQVQPVERSSSHYSFEYARITE
ncbi:MAG: ribbon-helix-helix protein, CopG family [Promethearchaeota archaeon]